MPLPDLIEIVPLARNHPHCDITVPGSKSITNRALILAALGDGTATLRGALWSEDTQVMVDCLQRLGFNVRVEPDAEDSCNRSITVEGLGGRIPGGGTADQPLELFVGNAGTAARFLAAFVALGNGVYRLSGVPRMHERPQSALLAALRELGYRVDSPNDRLPAVIHGAGPWKPGSCRVSIAESSQFASALLLSARVAGWDVKIRDTGDAEEAPYVTMTERLIDVFPRRGGTFRIEPDASGGSYFWAAGWLLATLPRADGLPAEEALRPGSALPVEVRNWPDSGWQIDAEFPHFLPLPQTVSREIHLGDSIMTAIVLAADADAAWPSRDDLHHFKPEFLFTDLGRLRVQECERVAALKTELLKCGARIVEEGDTLRIAPSILHGAEIDTYHDHRMAMCFATLGLKVAGMKIKKPACVRKTFPNFFQKLAEPSPNGLGATVLDAVTRRVLTGADLFAG